jgi:lambda repressor-like predicted transcriptional regulator
VSDETVSSVIYGRTKSTRIARVIARRTGIPVTKLWPGRYDNSNHEAA